MDQFICLHCVGEMRFLAVIEEAPVIERILRHVRVWNPTPPLRRRRWRKTGRTIAKSRLPTILFPTLPEPAAVRPGLPCVGAAHST